MQEIVWNRVVSKCWTEWIVKVRIFFRSSEVQEILLLEEMIVVARHIAHNLLDPVALCCISLSKLSSIDLEFVVEKQGTDSVFTLFIVILVKSDIVS